MKRKAKQKTLTEFGIELPTYREPPFKLQKISRQTRIRLFSSIKLGIVGSRTCTDEYVAHTLIRRFLDFAKEGKQWIIKEVISGGAKGADTWAESFAKANNIFYLAELPSDWVPPPLRYFQRNSAIVNRADCILALWDGKSTGTLDTLRKAVKAKKPAYVMDFTQKEPDITEFRE